MQSTNDHSDTWRKLQELYRALGVFGQYEAIQRIKDMQQELKRVR